MGENSLPRHLLARKRSFSAVLAAGYIFISHPLAGLRYSSAASDQNTRRLQAHLESGWAAAVRCWAEPRPPVPCSPPQPSSRNGEAEGIPAEDALHPARLGGYEFCVSRSPARWSWGVEENGETLTGDPESLLWVCHEHGQGTSACALPRMPNRRSASHLTSWTVEIIQCSWVGGEGEGFGW